MNALHPEVTLKVSAYQRVAGMLVALLVIVGVVVTCLFIIWLTNQVFTTQAAVPVMMTNLGGGSPDGVVGESLEIEGPEQEEIAEETDLEEPQVEETVALVADLATKTADLDDPLINDDIESGGGGGHRGTGNQRGFGPGDGDGGVGPERDIRYDTSTLAAYARQLDFFKIELAVVGGSKNQVEYASGFSGQPTRRVGTAEAENALRRMYFSHRSGTLQNYDRQLLARAGINTQNRIILQFFPNEARDRLLVLEKQFRGLDQPDIRKTVWGIRSQGGSYSFYVVEQVPR